jgi:sec-independent protein translocase protein TatB
MFDFAWSEIAVLGVIALVVIGPKDLPRALKTAGFMVRRARMMAREFQNSVDDMIRESELHDIREQAAKAAGVDDLKQAVKDAMDPVADIRTAMAEPLGGTLAQEPALPPPAVDGTAMAAPLAEAAAAPAEPATAADHPAPAHDAPADLHRTPPAP